MKYLILISILLPLLFSCGNNIQFTNKEVVIKGTTNKLIIQVPSKCNEFSVRMKSSVELLEKYAKKDPRLKASYDKAMLISEFSERIEAITIAQCRNIQNTTVFDPDFSDQVFYSELVKNYIEYQKIRDLTPDQLGSSNTKVLIDSAINRVYNSMYNNKNDELIHFVNDISLSLNAPVGSTVLVYVNGKNVCSTMANASGEATCTISKQYLLPKPNEVLVIKVVASALGYESKQLNYTLGEALLLKKSGKKFDLN